VLLLLGEQERTNVTARHVGGLAGTQAPAEA
jgi:hypothetical protein